MQGYLSRDGIPPAEFLAAARAEVAVYGVEIIPNRVLGIEAGFSSVSSEAWSSRPGASSSQPA